MKGKKMKNKRKVLLKSFLLFIIVSMVLFYIWSKERSLNMNLPIDFEAFSSYGDFFGGVIGTLFAIIGVVFVYYTYKKQIEFQEKDQIESRFFELLKLHDKNVEELKNVDEDIFAVYIRNIKSFVLLINKYNVSKTVKRQKWKDSDILKLSYLYFFHGSSEYTSERLEGLSISKSEVRELTKYIEEQGIIYKGSYGEFGKYFRQLFQIVTYIDRKSILSYTEKQQYIKSLRVRLNIEEQYLFFLNSLVSNGLDWEKRKTNENDKLITKYNLLKNIPKEYPQLKGVDFKTEYLNLHYEFMVNGKTEERLRLEKIYNCNN